MKICSYALLKEFLISDTKEWLKDQAKFFV